MSHLAWSLFNGVKYLQIIFHYLCTLISLWLLVIFSVSAHVKRDKGFLYYITLQPPPHFDANLHSFLCLKRSSIKTPVASFYVWCGLIFTSVLIFQDQSRFKVDTQPWLWNSIIHMYSFVSSSQWKSQLAKLLSRQCWHISMADVYSLLRQHMRKEAPLGN